MGKREKKRGGGRREQEREHKIDRYRQATWLLNLICSALSLWYREEKKRERASKNGRWLSATHVVVT